MTIANPSLGLRGVIAVRRLRRAMDRHGAQWVGRRLVDQVVRQAYMHEVHVWYAADLTAPRPHRTLDPPLRVIKAGTQHLRLLDGLPTVYPDVAEERLAHGNDWWLVLQNGEPVFSCWVFRSRVPVLAADDGGLDLPPNVAFLEDSVTSPNFRGRGVAPAAWSAVCDALALEGQQTLVTKVGPENEPVRRALAKIGFAEVGTVELTVIGPLRRVCVDSDDSPGGRLAATLG